MSHNVKIHDGILENDMLFSGTVPDTKDKRMNALDNELRAWKKIVDIREFNIAETSPGVFPFTVEHVDTRIATGTVTFTLDPKDPLISITATGWRVSEAFPQSLRDAIINVVNGLQMTSMLVEFF